MATAGRPAVMLSTPATSRARGFLAITTLLFWMDEHAEASHGLKPWQMTNGTVDRARNPRFDART